MGDFFFWKKKFFLIEKNFRAKKCFVSKKKIGKNFLGEKKKKF